MANVYSIRSATDNCIAFRSKENALKFVTTILDDAEMDGVGEYAVMVTREEEYWRVDFRYTCDDDPVIFENAYYVDKHYREEDEDAEEEVGEDM